MLEYANILADESRKLSFDYRSSILKKYYVDMSGKYYFWLYLYSFWAIFVLILEVETEKYSDFV